MKFLTLQKIEVPSEMLAVFSVEFFELIKVEKPVDILLLDTPQSGFGGWCAPQNQTENGEIVMQREYVLPTRPRPVSSCDLKHIYVHELSHRLLQNEKHSIRFFCLNLCLQIRASNQESRLFESVDLYDLSDVIFSDVPAAFGLAFSLAHSLAITNLTAEQVAKKIQTELTDNVIENKKNEVLNLQKELSELKASKFFIFVLGVIGTSTFWLFVLFIFGNGHL